MGILDGKVAIVTGAGGGLGRAHALLLAKEGAAVVVNDLGGAVDGSGDGSRVAEEVVKEIKAAGGEAIANFGSVTNGEEAQEMVAAAVSEFGKLDILINNAGILRDKSFKKMTDELWDPVIAVHLKGTFYPTKAAYAQMIEQGTGGRIIMTSSTSGLIGNFGQTNYGAAKAGIAGFMRCLAIEAVKAKITVNVLAPNAYSRMTASLFPEGSEDRFAPEMVSPAIAWLCSDEAGDITGRQFVISGNRVTLLYPAAYKIADRDAAEGHWDPAEVGEQIRKSMSEWPKATTVPELIF
ncbi:MAG: SDR family NAD(P)-dependent oxidoreductase [Deltaproteobacteria bacterium]|nr:SDR family NAD(P)-dependent oxidoreductase [Deltaproteobacteria bacterium]MBW2389864.1 SDR family NAD(P)-dependent oxidoreductase [Deltaproteobacteria bacterium]MBW2726514.1 SDR family NAD(P)-dependent oxidoreductase [Deltaproteobacteria bacterium]